jgi:hypothetical protein
MHNHSKNGGHKGMMWMMIPCLLLIAVVLFSRDKLVPPKYLWLIIVGVCVVPHVWMMFKGRGGHGEYGDANMEDKTDDVSEEQPGEKDEGDEHDEKHL